MCRNSGWWTINIDIDLASLLKGMESKSDMAESYKNKYVIVTGATGLIGSHLVEKMLSEGAKVIAIGRNQNKLEDVFKGITNHINLSFLVGNILDGILDNIDNIDYIFHAASPISGLEIAERPVDTIEANLLGTRLCLECLRKQKEKTKLVGKLIIFSSATVYGNCFAEDIIVTEKETYKADALDTVNAPYFESKRMIEVLAKAYHTQYGVESSIVRISYAYGYTKYKPNTAFYEFIDGALAGRDIVLNNSGIGRRDNIYVKDVVEGLSIVALKGNVGEAYNISSNGEKGNFSGIDEIAEIIASCVNEKVTKKIRVKIKAHEGNRAPGMLLDNSKLKELGWPLKTDIHEGIKDTIEKYIWCREVYFI